MVRCIQSEISRKVLTQTEVARMAGVSRQRLNAILQWKSKSKKTIRAVAKVLGILEDGNASR
jgi:transcriptional regulator with XRE-family HTH domain